jgi:hypothetical protein
MSQVTEKLGDDSVQAVVDLSKQLIYSTNFINKEEGIKKLTNIISCNQVYDNANIIWNALGISMMEYLTSILKWHFSPTLQILTIELFYEFTTSLLDCRTFLSSSETITILNNLIKCNTHELVDATICLLLNIVSDNSIGKIKCLQLGTVKYIYAAVGRFSDNFEIRKSAIWMFQSLLNEDLKDSWSFLRPFFPIIIDFIINYDDEEVLSLALWCFYQVTISHGYEFVNQSVVDSIISHILHHDCYIRLYTLNCLNNITFVDERGIEILLASKGFLDKAVSILVDGNDTYSNIVLSILLNCINGTAKHVLSILLCNSLMKEIIRLAQISTSHESLMTQCAYRVLLQLTECICSIKTGGCSCIRVLVRTKLSENYNILDIAMFLLSCHSTSPVICAIGIIENYVFEDPNSENYRQILVTRGIIPTLKKLRKDKLIKSRVQLLLKIIE